MRRRIERRRLLLALGISLALHVLALVGLRVPEGGARSTPPPAPIEVALVRPPAPPPAPESEREPQIVAPPEVINDEPPPDTRFESDRDNTVLEETVRPGVPNPAPPVPRAEPEVEAEAEPPVEPAPPAERDGEAATELASVRRGHAPALADLFASTDELVRAQESDGAREDETRDAEDPDGGPRRVAIAPPLAVPDFSLAGRYGTLDYLPLIQRGAVTLLNTKANAFSPFVRRVGERVFQHLVIRQRQLEMPHILSAREPVQMRVLLTPAGKLQSVRVEAQSGSKNMDDTLAEALKTAAFDNNPPPAAANGDGNFEFVFQARLRAYNPGPGGQPSRIESRLSVGLL